MHRTRGTILSFALAAAVVIGGAPAAHAAIPAWARPAVRWAANKGYIRAENVKPNAPMSRSLFTRLMRDVFGGGYTRTEGYVTAAEVDSALVRAVGEASTARFLDRVRAADGWDPGISRREAFEIVARELGLRYNREVDEGERFEASSGSRLRQADTLYAIHKAKLDPDTWASDALMDFKLGTLSSVRKKVVKFAFNQAGSPYVWAGEWKYKTPAGYPYGAQAAGGFDCTGFVWYVLQRATSSYNPPNRGYAGWSLPDRSSVGIAQGTTNKLRYSELKVGDVLVFTERGGFRSSASTAYHGAIYLGNHWMIHSTGSRDGVSLAYVGGSYWRDHFAWGRRVIR